MSRFREITTRDLRRLNQAARDLAVLPNLDAIEIAFVQIAADLLPGDCITWNNWTLDMNAPLTSRANPGYETEITRLIGPLNEFVGFHPVIASGNLPLTRERPQRLTDFQSHASFKENPLFKEVYRHVDSHFQLGSIPAQHANGTVGLTWNRRRQDFTERDRDVLQLIGVRLDVIFRRLDERQRLERACTALQSRLPSIAGVNQPATLSPSEGRLLAGLVRGQSRADIAARLGWRRDTLDRRLAYLRERLGFENNSLLLRALAEKTPSNAVPPQTDSPAS